MRSSVPPPHPTRPEPWPTLSGRALALPATFATVLIAALSVAFVVAPRMLAAASASDGAGFADRRALVGALREAFVGYWTSGARDLSPGMQDVVDYWFRYHVAKAAIAAILLIVLAVIGVALWKAFLRAGARGTVGRTAIASAGVLVTTLALFALATVMANIQGAIAPYASLLPMLNSGAPEGRPGGDASEAAAGALDQARQRLADSLSTGTRTPPALETMTSDFARYHVAMAVIAAVVAVALFALSVVLWKRRTRTEPSDRRTRRLLGSFGTASALLSLVVIVVAVANTTTAADPEPALLAFLDGGW